MHSMNVYGFVKVFEYDIHSVTYNIVVVLVTPNMCFLASFHASQALHTGTVSDSWRAREPRRPRAAFPPPPPVKDNKITP